MADLYRVFPHLPTAAPDQPGGALFIPPQGGGRIDNPSTYSVLYLSSNAAGAISECFGRLPEWRAGMLEGSPTLPGSYHAVARYTFSNETAICNLDDPRKLLALQIRPSDVVSRDYARTREWARRIHAARDWAGVRWWSYYNPEWSSYALWNSRGLALADISKLTLDHPALLEAARTIFRPLITPKPRYHR